MSGTAAKPRREKVRCLVVQLSGLAESLQSLMSLRAAQQLYPELEISLLVPTRVAPAARRVPWIENVYTIQTRELADAARDGEINEAQAIGRLARWLAPVIEAPWDFVVNWSYTESSSFLTALIPGDVKLGYSRRKDGSFSCADGWSTYVQAIVRGDVHQDIHVTDILTTQFLTALQIHLGEPEDPGDAAVTSKEFFSVQMQRTHAFWREFDSSRRWVGLQLGEASRAAGWDARRWADLAGYILRRHPSHNVVLLGTAAEREMVREILVSLGEKERRRIVPLTGETDFDLWASVISVCRWVISAEAAAVHLASVLGTRVLHVGAWRRYAWMENGPYGNAHYVVAPRGRSDSVSAEAAYAVWSYADSEWSHHRSKPVEEHFAQLGWATRTESIQVHRARIRQTESGGGVVYDSLLRRALDADEWFSMVMGHIARSWYCGWTPPVGHELSRERIGADLVRYLRTLQESREVLDKVLKRAIQSSNDLSERAANLRSDKVMGVGDRTEIESLGRDLAELDELIERMGKVQEPLRAFSQMAKVMMHNLYSERLSDLARESSESYAQLRDGLKMLSDWMDHSMKLVRPVVVASASAAKADKPAEVTQ